MGDHLARANMLLRGEENIWIVGSGRRDHHTTPDGWQLVMGAEGEQRPTREHIATKLNISYLK